RASVPYPRTESQQLPTCKIENYSVAIGHSPRDCRLTTNDASSSACTRRIVGRIGFLKCDLDVIDIRQSVQNGQFLSSLAHNAPHLLVASHADKRVERLLVQVIVTTPAVDQTPALQLGEPAYHRSTGHAHVGSNLGDRERLPVHVTNRHA